MDYGYPAQSIPQGVYEKLPHYKQSLLRFVSILPDKKEEENKEPKEEETKNEKNKEKNKEEETEKEKEK